MYFTSNHDDNSWYGTIEEQLGESTEAWAVFVQTFSGMPMIYSGQEAGLDHRLLFFDKDLISWNNLDYEDLYKKLVLLKKNNPALWTGEAGGMPVRLSTDLDSQIFAFSREKGENKVVVILNLSNTAYDLKITDISAIDNYTDVFTGNIFNLTSDTLIHLEAWKYIVLEK
jgi:glycosidase